MPQLPLVLIADDEEIYQLIVSAMVKRIGLPIITARDGLEAVELFAQHRQRIGCVLMDVQMPHMDGADACRRIREMDETMPVIFTSGYLDAKTRELLAPLHPLGLLKKPVGYSELSVLLAGIIAATPHQGEMSEIPDSACGRSRGQRL